MPKRILKYIGCDFPFKVCISQLGQHGIRAALKSEVGKKPLKRTNPYQIILASKCNGPQVVQRLLKTGQQEIKKCSSVNPLSRMYINPTAEILSDFKSLQSKLLSS